MNNLKNVQKFISFFQEEEEEEEVLEQMGGLIQRRLRQTRVKTLEKKPAGSRSSSGLDLDPGSTQVL